MKILRVAADLYPDVVGGIGLHAHEMSKVQTEMGHDVTVLTTTEIENKPRYEERKGYEIIRFNPDLKLLGNSIVPKMFKYIIEKEKEYDIIHAHSHLFFTTNISALASNLRKTPLVVTNHGLISQTPPRWFSKLYIHSVGKWTFNSSDAIICYTEEMKDELLDLKINSKVEVIHNGINTELFRPNPSGKKDQILWVGRYLPGKGVQYLVKAFKLVLEEYSNIKLLMIGDGPLRNEIKQLARSLGVHENIDMKTFVPNREMPKYYAKAKVFALPSLDEGVPRTILESLSCGTPVVSTDLPQLIEIVQHSGYTVSKRNSMKLATQIINLINDEEKRRKMGREGRKKIRQNYSWRETVEQTVRLYEKLVNL